MTHAINIRIDGLETEQATNILKELNCIKEIIMTTKDELTQQLTDLTTQANKAKEEIVQKVSNLETAISSADASSPQIDAAMQALKGSIQSLDDLNTDAATGGGTENPPA